VTNSESRYLLIAEGKDGHRANALWSERYCNYERFRKRLLVMNAFKEGQKSTSESGEMIVGSCESHGSKGIHPV
jgi:hypothetical protein